MAQISSGPNGVAVEETHGSVRIIDEFREQVRTVISRTQAQADWPQGEEAQEGPSILHGTLCTSEHPRRTLCSVIDYRWSHSRALLMH